MTDVTATVVKNADQYLIIITSPSKAEHSQVHFVSAGKATVANAAIEFDADQQLAFYPDWIFPTMIREQAVLRLTGRDLACWCPLDQPCHANALLEIAAAAS